MIKRSFFSILKIKSNIWKRNFFYKWQCYLWRKIGLIGFKFHRTLLKSTTLAGNARIQEIQKCIQIIGCMKHTSRYNHTQALLSSICKDLHDFDGALECVLSGISPSCEITEYIVENWKDENAIVEILSLYVRSFQQTEYYSIKAERAGRYQLAQAITEIRFSGRSRKDTLLDLRWNPRV